MAPDGPGGGHYPSSPPSFVDRGDGRLPSGGTHWPAAGQRELFHHASSPLRKHAVSRSTKQREGRIRRRIDDVNEAVDSLNWLAGRGPSLSSTPSPMQRQVLSRLDGLAFRQQPKGGVPAPEEALCELLRGGSPYDWKPTNETLASYQAELVSIPDDVRGCPDLGQVLPRDDLRYLEEKSELMLRCVEDLDQSEPIAPYWDPKLKFNKKEYHRLVQRLHGVGYFHFTTRPASSVGIFFVWKSSRTRLRLITLITDAR